MWQLPILSSELASYEMDGSNGEGEGDPGIFGGRGSSLRGLNKTMAAKSHPCGFIYITYFCGTMQKITGKQKVDSFFIAPIFHPTSVSSSRITRLAPRNNVTTPRNLQRYLFSVVLLIMISTSSAVTTRSLSIGRPLTTRYEYEPPIWVRDKLKNVPEKRLCLANLPTPLYQWSSVTQSSSRILQRLRELDITLYIKRDDMTGGCETGGNKIRKLEFLLADALDQGCDKVITIGGEQSNHCRATASACRMLGLEPHLILRTERANDISTEMDGGIGWTGNLLFDRMVGSHIYTCTPGEYGRVGSKAMVTRLSHHLETTLEGKVYPILVGGSNGLGTWGYIDAVDEVLSQWSSIESNPSLDHVIFACGSGGTAAGIAVGIGLALEHETFKDWRSPTVHAMGVCDSPDYFYSYVAGIADEMGIVLESGTTTTTEEFIRQCMTVHQGKGRGYAASSPEELEFISALSVETGVVLDPVYSGKALYHFFTTVLNGDDTEKYRGTNILFWHTGGALGLFDKAADLSQRFPGMSPVKRLDIYGKGARDDEINISQSPDEAN